jgi:hypothetical protein
LITTVEKEEICEGSGAREVMTEEILSTEIII